MNKPNCRLFVPGYTFKEPGKLGTIQIFFDDFRFHTMKLSCRFGNLCPLLFKRSTNGQYIRNPTFHTDSFSLKGKNNLPRVEPSFRTFKVDTDDFYKLLLEPLTPCFYNFGHNRWANEQSLRFGIIFIAFSMPLAWIQDSLQSNDDLVGFFNSLPQHRLLDGIHSLIVEWKHRRPDTVLSVDMAQRGNPVQLSYVGKIHGAPKKTKIIYPQDIFPIVQASLSCHIFQALNVIWQQIRGAGIGSHISPSLSNLAVTIVERSWHQAFRESLDPPSFPFLAIRYVDNRYILFPEEKAQEPSLQVLSSEDFYQHPVELEKVTNNELLGFLVDPVTRTVTYKLPETWQIRDFASAGSIRLRLSGLQSRCHLISRYSYPQQRVQT